ncbi:hypothetical protein KKH14_00505 [Patescibacteria group bacterium]|nr:hypothetical protein [Patescibacteria group bacterium]
METRETIEKCLAGNIRIERVSEFEKLFIFLIFAGGSTMPRPELLEHIKCIFKISARERKDELALATLKKINKVYHIIEEETEKKKERYHYGDASRRADSKFFEFIISIYPTIAWKSHELLMQKTRFQMLEYASKQWEQLVCSESYNAFRFLIRVFESQEKKEILEKILRSRVEKFFTKVESIEQWLLLCEKDPVPYEIQQLLVMARAKAGGPELAKKDIANSMAMAIKKDE